MSNKEDVMKAMEQAADQVNANTGEATLDNVVGGGTQTINGDAVVAKLKAFVNKHNLALESHGKYYLRAEAWQYLANLLGVYPAFDSAAEVQVSRSANGKDFRQYIVSTGCTLYDKNHQEVSRATMIASNHEEFLKNKELFATWGMSQTRAFSRAMRNVFGYLVLAAGYQALPWEELGKEGVYGV